MPYFLDAHNRLEFTVSFANTFDFWYRLQTPNEWLINKVINVYYGQFVALYNIGLKHRFRRMSHVYFTCFGAGDQNYTLLQSAEAAIHAEKVRYASNLCQLPH